MNDIDAKLTDEYKKIIKIAKPSNQSAYELYAKGLAMENYNTKQVLTYFENAIKFDENYVDAITSAGWISGVTLNLFSKGEKYLLKAERILQKKTKQIQPFILV